SLLLMVPLPFCSSFYLTDSSPLLPFNNQVKEVHLYTAENHRRAMYLQIALDGSVSGSDARSTYSVLQLKSIQPGHVVIRGKASSMFLCVDSGGRLRGQGPYSEADCSFRELLLGDGYTRFLSSQHGSPLSLASRPSPDPNSVPFTRFLPIRTAPEAESVIEEPPSNQRYVNVDSEDLLGMGLNTVVSPQFSA
uniref:Fibroblast growth factor n=1 Tax=Gasterosteus aculeatus TaxID=69293 RepID=G3NZD1_GASAC